MAHPLVLQLYFTRSEFQRAIEGLSEAEACQRFRSTNCISWNIGHLACMEQGIWLTQMQGETPLPHLAELFGYGQPASTPPLTEVLEAWQTVTQRANPFLDTLTTEILQEVGITNSWSQQTHGSLLHRVNYHYWYHIGEIMALRQLLGQSELPEFVGDLDTLAPYLPE